MLKEDIDYFSGMKDLRSKSLKVANFVGTMLGSAIYGFFAMLNEIAEPIGEKRLKEIRRESGKSL